MGIGGFHLFRWDRHLERARDPELEQDEAIRSRRFTIAYWVNRILEENFGELLRASDYRWPTALEAEVRAQARTDEVHESKVSHYLVASVSERQVFWLTLAGVVGLLLLGRHLGRLRAD